MKKIVVLGAGLVGKAMAIDLAKKFDVTSVDVSEQALAEVQKHGIKTLKADFSNLQLLSSNLKRKHQCVSATSDASINSA